MAVCTCELTHSCIQLPFQVQSREECEVNIPLTPSAGLGTRILSDATVILKVWVTNTDTHRHAHDHIIIVHN